MKRIGLLALLFFCTGFIWSQSSEIITDETVIQDNSIVTEDEEYTENIESEIKDEEVLKTDAAETEVSQSEDKEKELVEIVVSENTAETDEKDIELQQKMTEYLEIIIDSENSLSKENNSDEIINQIEAKKAQILELRDKIQEKTLVYYRKVDDELVVAQNEVLNAPISIAESNGNGGLSETAANRRKNKCLELERNAEKDKKAYEKQIQNELGADEKKELSELNTLYKNLESKNFNLTSYSANTTVEIKEFNVDEGCWTLNFKCDMFDIEKIVETSVKIPYSEVTGKKYVAIDKLSESEFESFRNSLEIYSELFASMPQIFYTKLTFQTYRWKLASEYRMVPLSLEVTFLGRKNSNVIKSTELMNARVFQRDPVIEVRSKAEISNDAVKATKIIAAEAKERETEADKFYKEYTDSYENNKKSNSKEPVIQKGRGAFIVSANRNITSSEIGDLFTNFDANKLLPVTVDLELDFPIGPFSFWGINAGFDVPLEPGKLRLEAGANFGFNYIIGNWFRPYIMGSGKVDTTFNGMLGIGAGFDFIVSKTLLFNIGYNYKWSYNFNNVLNPNVDKSGMTDEEKNAIPCSSGHNFSVGIGLAW